MTGKEIFEMLYDGKIANNECIEFTYEDDEEGNHFILRDVYNLEKDLYYDFDYKRLLTCLLYKGYTFKIVKQKEAMEILEKYGKEKKINELEEQLKFLKGEE